MTPPPHQPIHPDAVRVALSDQAAADELGPTAIARRARGAGWRIGQSQAQAVISGTTPNPRTYTLLAILAGMGRDLRWLHRAAAEASAELYARDAGPVTP